MKQVKCVVSIELPLPGGGFKRFEAGTVYPIEGLDEHTIQAYFEHPEKSPPKGLQTRGEKPGAEEAR